MNQQLQQDFAQIEQLLNAVTIQGTDYLQQLNTRSSVGQKPQSEPSALAVQGVGTLNALKLFNTRFEPLMVGSSGPRYWGFVTGGATPASIVGDWLTTIYDQNPQGTTAQGDVSALIELETIQLLLELFELPKDFLGGFVTGATLSNFTCLAVARQWLGNQLGKDFAKDGVSGQVHVLTATPHSSAVKSLAMLGLGSNNFTKISVLADNREAIDVADLEGKILELQGQPFILISSGGTVNTVDFDDFEAIAALKAKYNFWWHIDAAFGAFAVLSTTHRHLIKGWERADSITIDCHKWLNVPYENAVFFVKEKHNRLQVETFQNSNAPYLGNPLENFSYLNFLPENSRRLRALPVWFALQAYGKTGLASVVETCIHAAQSFGEFIESHPGFELLAPVRLNTVCFTLSRAEHQENLQTFLTQLNDSGLVFMTPTVYNGKKGIRAAFVNWLTKEDDVRLVTDKMGELLKNILPS
jgi:glutamate/tyrosine decarboxylase-like PLP-dependent enzyme